MAKKAPCAKFKNRIAPKMTLRPLAMRKSSMPSPRPETIEGKTFIDFRSSRWWGPRPCAAGAPVV